VSIRIRRRGSKHTSSIEGAGLKSKPVDRVLVDLIGGAHLLLRRLTDDSDATLAQLSTQSGIHIADCRWHFPRCGITGEILPSRQPAELSACKLLRADDLSFLWGLNVNRAVSDNQSLLQIP
jgi:hypothetical protein